MSFLDKIYCPEKQQERAFKPLRLNSGTDYEPRLLAASSLKKKPTIRIKRLSLKSNDPNGIKLKGASSIQNQLQMEREKARKALRLVLG